MAKKKKDIDEKIKNVKKEIEEAEKEELEEVEAIKKVLLNKKVSLIIIISFFIAILGALCLYIALPKIKLNGKSTVKISYNTEYKEKGAKAKWLTQDISDRVKISGKVNTKKVGNYKITYTAKKGFLKVKKTRLVKVVDEKKPKITLEGDKDLTICPDAKYKELGYKAYDEYDGDLTKKVKTNEKKDKVIYTVKDSSGNKKEVIRTVKKEDKTAPEMELNGNDHVYITQGIKFTDSKAKATDNCSGDLTDKIEVSGSVDSNTLGDYELTYTVKDEYGNEASIKRTVTVQKEVVKREANLSCGEPGVIYLTFDDGPGGDSTIQILNVLKKYDVKATFFVTSNGSDALIKREYDEGHLVALHTASHSYPKVYASDEAYWNDLNAVNNKVEKVTGKKSYFVRFPGGSSNTVSRHYSYGIMSRLTWDLESKGYSYYDWNLDSNDAGCGKTCSSGMVYRNVVNGLSKSHGNVILMHDIHWHTAGAIEDIVKYGLDNGYKFKVLDSSVICHHKTSN